MTVTQDMTGFAYPQSLNIQKIQHQLCDISSTCTSGEIEDDILIAVGRTDGSLRIVQLGNEYMTNFKAGFTDALSSICLNRSLLITDGMSNYVCLHDF